MASKLTDRALHLLSSLARGQNRIFAWSDCPPGWKQIEKAGLARRTGEETAELTEEGMRAYSTVKTDPR